MEKSSIVWVGSSSDALTKEQKTFNRLTSKIKKLRDQLSSWKKAADEGRQFYFKEIEPRTQALWGVRADLVRLFDTLTSEKKLTHTEKNKLKQLIASVALDLLLDQEDDELKAIYNRNSGRDFDADAAEESEILRQSMAEMLGRDFDVDLNVTDLRSPEKVMEKMHQVLKEQFLEEEEAKKAKASMRKKTAKQLAKEELERQFEEQASQSLRDVYRKLVSSLHPDREPDPAERERKTALMQRLNQAYEAGDLLYLLELQLEIEQLNPTDLAALSTDRLKYFIKMLKEQVFELEREIEAVQLGLQVNLKMNTEGPVFRIPSAVVAMLKFQMKDLDRQIQCFQDDLDVLWDVKQLKLFLKAFSLSALQAA